MRTTSITLSVLVLLLASATGAWAQESRVVQPEELRAAVTERANEVEAEREQLRAILERADVQEVADRQGIDLERIRNGVGTLSASQLQQVMPLVRTIAGDHVGGQVLNISAATLIVVLLLVILLVIVAS